MNAKWITVVVAAFFEVFWVIGLKYANGFWSWSGTTFAIIVSFSLMIMAGRKLPVGTVYAVFVGLGTVGTIFTDFLFFDEPLKITKVVLILILLLGVLGLKLVTHDSDDKGVEA